MTDKEYITPGGIFIVALIAIVLWALVTWSLVWQPKPAVVNQAWGWVQGCTATVPERGKNPNGQLESVVWRTFKPGTLNDSMPGRVIGLTVHTPGWVNDTIYIDTDHQDTVWVLAHELLHHVLADRDVWGSDHPFVPFAFPCHLFEWQQNGIGIMGQGHQYPRPPTRTP
jgi:hypothetical protein